MFKFLLFIVFSITLNAGALSDSIGVHFGNIKHDISLLFLSILVVLILIFAFKKILFMLEISDFAIDLQLKQKERKAKRIKQRGQIKNSFLKTSQTQKEKSRRERLHTIKQDRKNKISEKNRNKESIKSIQKRLDKKEKYVSKGGDKLRAKNGRVITAKPKKVYHTKDFMSKKYRNAVMSGKFKKKRTYRYQKSFRYVYKEN